MDMFVVGVYHQPTSTLLIFHLHLLHVSECWITSSWLIPRPGHSSSCPATTSSLRFQSSVRLLQHHRVSDAHAKRAPESDGVAVLLIGCKSDPSLRFTSVTIRESQTDTSGYEQNTTIDLTGRKLPACYKPPAQRFMRQGNKSRRTQHVT
jgi:hypothetical protein